MVSHHLWVRFKWVEDSELTCKFIFFNKKKKEKNEIRNIAQMKRKGKSLIRYLGHSSLAQVGSWGSKFFSLLWRCVGVKASILGR